MFMNLQALMMTHHYQVLQKSWLCQLLIGQFTTFELHCALTWGCPLIILCIPSLITVQRLLQEGLVPFRK